MIALALLLGLTAAAGAPRAGLPLPSPTAPSAQEEKAGDHVVIILDASGSMEKPMRGDARTMRMNAAKGAIQEVLKKVPQSTHVGLLVFSGKNVPEDWVFPLGERDDERLVAGLTSIAPDGGTPLGAYMKRGADRLLEVRAANHGYGNYRMLVVTDGVASDPEDVAAFLPDIMTRGLTIDVIGVSMAKDHPLATEVHSYRRADDQAALQQALSEVFAEVGGGDGGSDAEAYELIAGLPDGMAMDVIAAISEVENSPIEKVNFRPQKAPRGGASQGSSSPVESTSHGTGGAASGGGGFRAVFVFMGFGCLAFFAIALIVLIKFVKRAKGGKGRRFRRRS